MIIIINLLIPLTS